MATAPARQQQPGNGQTKTQQTTAPQQTDAAKLLEQILERQPNELHRAVNSALHSRIEKLEMLLPKSLKGEGERLIQRAIMTLSDPKMKACPPADYVKIVLEAAEMGLAIDGKFCYAVPYKGKWQCIPDYKGLVAVARRCGLIEDVEMDIICENDTFHHSRSGNGTKFVHERPQVGKPRGKTIGAYCRILFPGGRWRVEVMDRAELEGIRARSPAKNSGPWVTDTNEMYKKTVCKRSLKLYGGDHPVLSRAMASGENWDGESEVETAFPQQRPGPALSTGTMDQDDVYQEPTVDQTEAETRLTDLYNAFVDKLSQVDSRAALTALEAEIRGADMDADRKKVLLGECDKMSWDFKDQEEGA
jgi:recombination protein RecT